MNEGAISIAAGDADPTDQWGPQAAGFRIAFDSREVMLLSVCHMF